MRPFGIQILGQGATFIYLTQASQEMPNFSPAMWPQFSIYNFLIANFWPVYWIGFAMDRARSQQIYRHVFEIAHERAGDISSLIQMMIGHAR
jgi:hypothetical protein